MSYGRKIALLYLIRGQSALQELLSPLRWVFNECEWSGYGREKKDREEKSDERILKSGNKDRGKTYLPNPG